MIFLYRPTQMPKNLFWWTSSHRERLIFTNFHVLSRRKKCFPLRKSDYLSRFVYRIDDLLFLLLRPIPPPPLPPFISLQSSIFSLTFLLLFFSEISNDDFSSIAFANDLFIFTGKIYLSFSLSTGGEEKKKCALL